MQTIFYVDIIQWLDWKKFPNCKKNKSKHFIYFCDSVYKLMVLTHTKVCLLESRVDNSRTAHTSEDFKFPLLNNDEVQMFEARCADKPFAMVC